MPRLIAPEIKKFLENRDWLFHKHVTDLYSIGEISTELRVTYATVAKALRRHNIISPSKQQLREASNQRKYGVKNIGEITREKALTTFKERYGGHFFSRDGRRDIRDSIMMEKYGTDNVGGLPVFIEKARQTSRTKYGRNHYNQKHFQEGTFEKLYDVEWLYEEHYIKKKSLSQMADELGLTDMTTVMRHLHQVGLDTLYHSTSFEETQLLSFIKTLTNEHIVSNTRDVIPPYELDIYVPSKNIAIEYCGLFWHTEEAGKGRYYHKTKWEKCKSRGIQLITIFSDDWLLKQDIVKQFLTYIFGQITEKVYARKCEIVIIDDKTSSEFLNRYHIQGSKSGSVRYGLRSNDNLVAVIVLRQTNDGTWYIERYATSCNVIGGFTKLLTHFEKTHTWNTIVTFADLCKSQGKLYENSGFNIKKMLKPDYEYILNNKRVHKFNFRHSVAAKRLIVYDRNLSEAENCKVNGIRKVWDCGKIRFEKHNGDSF